MPHSSVQITCSTRQRVPRHAFGVVALLVAALVVPGLGCQGDIGAERSVSPGGIPGAPAGNGPAAAPSGNTAAMVQAADAAMKVSNPTLFDASLRYFPATVPAGGPKRLFRLTRSQLDVTTKALLPMQYKTSVLETMPRDPLQTNYEYADNLSFNAANFTPYTRWVEALVAGVRLAPTSVVDCTAMNNAPSCLEGQAKLFVSRAFRGVVTDAQLARFTSFFTSSVAAVGVPDATGDLVDLTLTSPHYVFRDEVQTDAGFLMTPAQQLQNISYTLADAPPDALGLPVATAAAQLSTVDGVQKTIEKVLSSKEARQKLMRFFIDWLEIRAPDEFTIAADVFPEFTPALAAAELEETRAFLNHQLSAAAPKLKDITQSTQSFVTDALAPIYGIRNPSKTGLVALDPTQRLGIFTQPAVVASHSGPTTTRLVKRGVFFTRKVMCLPLGQPPPGVNTTLPTNAGTTERQKVEVATASGTCQGCHAFINPFGFMQENYDAIGRWRTTDQGMPINASISVDFLDEGKLTTASPIDALRSLTSSLRFQQCFARQLFRFYMGRDEGAGDDPLLRQMFFGFADGNQQDIIAMLQTLARSSTFSQRTETP